MVNLGSQGEFHGKGGLFSGGWIDNHCAIMVFCNDEIGDRQAETGADANLFGGKKWLEDSMTQVVVDADTVIFNFRYEFVLCRFQSKNKTGSSESALARFF